MFCAYLPNQKPEIKLLNISDVPEDNSASFFLAPLYMYFTGASMSYIQWKSTHQNRNKSLIYTSFIELTRKEQGNMHKHISSEIKYKGTRS